MFAGRRILVEGGRGGSSVAAWICAEGGGSLGGDCDFEGLGRFLWRRIERREFFGVQFGCLND